MLDKDFSKIYLRGKRASTQNLNLIYLRTGQNTSRFGFVVSKKQAPRIVDRNRIKRRLRAQVYLFLPRIIPGFDIVISGKKSLLGTDVKELKQEIDKLIRKVKLLKQL